MFEDEEKPEKISPNHIFGVSTSSNSSDLNLGFFVNLMSFRVIGPGTDLIVRKLKIII